MESYKMLGSLKKIPKSESTSSDLSKEEMFFHLETLKDRDVVLQAGIYSSIIGYQILETRNVPDELFDAYASQYPNMSSNGVSLYEKYVEVYENGEGSISGLVNGVKGKQFEYYVQDLLPDRYPNYDFIIAESANQPIWDIKGISQGNGEEMLIQVKMMAPAQANHLSNIMQANPNVYYATSSEIREKILAAKPELEEQFIPIDISNYEFTQGVKDGLETLRENLGIDVPDEIFALAPYSTEIILGIRLLLDLASVKRDFEQVQITDKARLGAVKVLILFSRFGINAILGAVGSSLGSMVTPGIGTAVGVVGGVVVGSILNRKIAPYSLKIAYTLVGLDEEDVFYFKNIKKIDDLAIEYRNNSLLLQQL
ncbi:DUF456 domain-containing protein [Bacillus cereus group sp. N34]|uniref:DUF456 domain-containing protein n=1 Tax=Bacillus cereus group sp. N34 TaxID=2794595 RepID=UPI0018F5D942|nr:DUF456 domain-containing protein [Bacillus cereus group sp. N34]MBJ8018705.1 DUF456 domain-containing protein [Bacillus cereus group sp. N34]